MKKYSWVSPYREKLFLESHNRNIENFNDDLFEGNREKVIVIMLDVQGTIDGIDDEKAETFIKQLHKLRIKYGANKVIINMSSHMHTPNSLIKYLEILHRNLRPNIVLDTATYLFGEYNYETCEDEVKEFGYNLNKTDIFESKYFSKYNVLCHGIIDDSVSDDYIKRFKNDRPVFIIRPSVKNEQDLSKDNIMCYSTLTEGFDGVLECLDSYLEHIKDIPAYDIVGKQKVELIHLSAFEVGELCREKNFDLIYKYVFEGKLDYDDYEKVARELTWLLKSNLEIFELNRIRDIIVALGNHLHKDNKHLELLIKNVNKAEIK